MIASFVYIEEEWLHNGDTLWFCLFLVTAPVVFYLYHVTKTVIAKLHQKFSDRRNGEARK